jgi:hypothetical protein
MALAGWLLFIPPAFAYLDIEDRGPVLTAGGFALRVTNAGILGNAFFDSGLSNDPSFEIRPGSGAEALNHAALWVGGLDEFGNPRVSGGPLLEWRPTLDPEDRVRGANKGRPGTQRLIDDDGDGVADEEALNRVDDDGDGEIDEDLGLFSEHMMSAYYVDDRPEAVQYVYEGGEQHKPFGLSVRQDAYAWNAPGHEGIAGLSFTITNHSGREIKGVRIGLFADLDSRDRNSTSGHLNDRALSMSYQRTVVDGTYSMSLGGDFCGQGQPLAPCAPVTCTADLQQTVPVLTDFNADSGMPLVAVVPLLHTTDPLALITPVRGLARAPAEVSFEWSVFARGRAPRQGGLPTTDAERYQALSGTFAQASTASPDDYAFLISCGPFSSLRPGQSLEFHVALVATLDPDSLEILMGNAAVLHRGRFLNLQPDSLPRPYPNDWNNGVTGKAGHEICLEAPPGTTFRWDPHCVGKFDPNLGFVAADETYRPGSCIWTDADCDLCTGFGGNETHLLWSDPSDQPVPPSLRIVPGDHSMRIEWDNGPEVLANAGLTGPEGGTFAGYRLYKAADWRRRSSLLPPRETWALLGSFSNDTTLGQRRLSSITDTTLDYLRIAYEQPLYPVGRYAVDDPEVLNGFDYAYFVASVVAFDIEVGQNVRRIEYESAFTPSFDRVARPHASARDRAGQVWVVPNPFRGSSDWDRPPVIGDQLTRHVDFMGLPMAQCTIKIYTVSGDHVQTIHHDGTSGNGQAAWDLVSRNGQEVVSGIYLFMVDSPAGQQIGRFVIIR